MADALSAPAAAGSTRERSTDVNTEAQRGRGPTDLLSVRVFLIVLAGLLVGYMFMGRGFAHVGVPPLYVGEVVLFIGLITTAVAFVRLKLRVSLSPIVWLLLAVMGWGLARTVPYLPVYGVDALRDAVLWGYATFALMIYVLVDRGVLDRAFRGYGVVVPVFALWLPICFNIFLVVGASIDPNDLGSDIPLIFFKSGDMSVHIVGSIAFLVLGLNAPSSVRAFLWRSAIVVPLLWTAFVAAATNRGGLLAALIGLSVVAALAILLRRSRNWYPVVAAVPAVALVIGAPGLLPGTLTRAPSATPSMAATATPTTASSGASASASRSSSPSASPSPFPSPSAPDTQAPPAGSSSSPPPVSAIPPGAAAPSLVANSGFERGAVDNGTVHEWAFATGSYDIVGGGAYSGENFALVVATGEPGSARMWGEQFPVRAEDELSVSVRVRAISGSPSLEINVQWFDDSGGYLGTAVVDSVRTGGDTNWQEGSGILIPPANTARARIDLVETTGDGAAVGIDEVVVSAGDFVVVRPPAPDAADGRPATIAQIVENIWSVFIPSSDEGLEGTRRFRLRWWTAIVDYTVFGEYFWTGKGFGVNLANDDGFQPTGDQSLRAPHNSHITALARMGVPGLVLWVLLQAAFAGGLFRSILGHRRAGDLTMAAVGAWLLSYWTAMMVNTSFDPYIEGPQGGIWFWAIFGLGMVVMRLPPRPAAE